MIKKIQLRGISHKPSDKLTQDGGLEECIDLQLESQELGAAKAPDNVTDILAPGLSVSGIEVLYIHKGNDFTNYVGKREEDIPNITPGEPDVHVIILTSFVYNPDSPSANANGWVEVRIENFYEQLTFDSFTSIGNMLVFTTSLENLCHYACFKNGAYKYLGTQVPKPLITVNSYAAPEEEKITGYLNIKDYTSLYSTLSNNSTTKDFWNRVLENKNTDADAAGFYNSFVSFIWSKIDETRKKNRSSDFFCAPVAARFALRMFSGDYLCVSEPIILACDSSHTFVENVIAELEKPDGQTTNYKLAVEMLMKQVFLLSVSVSANSSYDWSDIIDSVDVFLSTDIMVPGEHTGLSSAAVSSDSPDPETGYVVFGDAININFEGCEYVFTSDLTNTQYVNLDVPRKLFLEELLKKDNFYLAESFQYNNLPNSFVHIKPVAQDDLVVRRRLSAGEAHLIIPIEDISSYNERLVSGAQRVILSRGFSTPHAKISSTGTAKCYKIFYHVRVENGDEILVSGYGLTNFTDASIRAYVAYPDARCYQADLYIGSIVGNQVVYTTKVILPMEEHPRLDCAYGFWGLDRQLDTPVEGDGRSSESASSLPSANGEYNIFNRLVLSEMDAPFVFPLGQRQRFSSKIIGAVPVTIPLSTGQFGYGDLYIFTKDGIWVNKMTDEGGMGAINPVSRDVALVGTIAQLDQAIAFVSSQGVMLLQGSQVACLSPFMEGPKYTIKDIAPDGSDLRNALSADGYGPLLNLSLETTSFKDFIERCKPLYDYENKRILLFNALKGYAYEYDIESQTWRKHSLPDTFTRVLNGYPNAYSYLNGKIYEWSVKQVFNVVNPTARKGWLLTRPFDLDAPDIRKSLNSIRVRGVYNHADVKYILLGSMNGIEWKRLTSLRGGSYKSFRLLILTNFTPGEKLSWVDIDYDVRFDNKLR